MVATTSTTVGPTWKREPDQTEAFAGLIFKKNGQVTERLVNKVAVDFFADQETGLPTKTVLERYIGPDFEVPDDYGNLKNLPDHPLPRPLTGKRFRIAWIMPLNLVISLISASTKPELKPSV